MKKLSETEHYKNLVYHWLDQLPAGVFELTKIVKTENREKFIAICKNYIDEKGRGVNGFDLDFNEDYSKLHKFDLVL